MGETINLCPDQTNPKATALQRDVHQQLSNALERRLDLSVDKVDDVLQQNVGGELFGARRAVGQAELEAGGRGGGPPTPAPVSAAPAPPGPSACAPPR